MAFILLFTIGGIPEKFGAGIGVGGLSAVAAAANVSSQDGIGYSGPIASNEVTGTVFTGYQAWPSGFNKGYSAFAGGVYDGTNIWMIPYNADRLIKFNPSTGEMTGYSNWPADFTKASNAFSGGVYDGRNIWLIPYHADRVVKVDTTTGVMTGYSGWPGGLRGSDTFIGGTFDGTSVWLAPFSGSRLIKIDKTTGAMTSYNDWPIGTTLGNNPFRGSLFDGDNIWLIPNGADRLIKVDPLNGDMTGYSNWPGGFAKVADAFWGGVFDGTNVWMIPNNATHVVKMNTATGIMTGYNGWPSGFTKGSGGFAGGVYDGTNIWLVPLSANMLIKVNASTGVMTGFNDWPSGFAKDSSAFQGGVYDGENVWMIPFAADRLMKFGNSSDLSGLTLSAGALSPAFRAETTSYTANVGNERTSIDIMPTAAEAAATVMVNGMAVTSGQAQTVALNVGDNAVTILVTSSNGNTKTYTVTVTVTRATAANTLVLPVTIRDFSVLAPNGHPDFGRTGFGAESGIVKPTLAADRKPEFNASPSGQVASASSFYQWFHDDDSVNMRKDTSLALIKNAGSGDYEFTNPTYGSPPAKGFYPIDGELWGNEGMDGNGNGHNFDFTLEAHSQFVYQAGQGQKVTITSDDDAWLFINGKLALDLGGIRGASTATVLLDSEAAALGLVSGQAYAIDIFHADRGPSASLFEISTNIVLDSTAPDTEIIAGPPAATNSADAAFEFRSGKAGVSFECSLDGGAFAPCASPLSVTGLTDGSHTLQVRALDLIGLADPAPASRTWTVDTVKPVITLNGAASIQVTAGTSFADPGATATDNGSVDLTPSIVVSGDTVNTSVAGSYTIAYDVADLAGNAADRVSRIVSVVARSSGGSPSAPSDIASGNAALTSLTLSIGEGVALTLSPEFREDLFTYEADTDEAQIVIGASTEHTATKTTYRLNGQVVTAGKKADLNLGANELVIQVQAENGTTRTYTVNIIRKSVEPIPVYKDTAGHWAEGQIAQAASLNIVRGYADGSFAPDKSVSRAEFLVMLMNALKPRTESSELEFSDAGSIGAWARDAVAQALQAGIVTGYGDGSFRPHAGITRSEMTVMIARALGMSAVENAGNTGFADDRDIPAWARDAVAALKQLGVVSGKGANRFDPASLSTRAEAVTVILNMLDR